MRTIKSIYYKLLKILLSPEKYAKYIGVKIGKDSNIHKSVSFGSEPYLIKIGDNVRITAGVNFVTHDGGVWVLRNLYKEKNCDKFGPIIIGNNVHIGINTTIMPGVSIGNNVIIGCNAVVTKDIPDNSVAVGVPAKVIKTIDEYYNNNKNKLELTKKMSKNEKKKYLLSKYKI